MQALFYTGCRGLPAAGNLFYAASASNKDQKNLNIPEVNGARLSLKGLDAFTNEF